MKILHVCAGWEDTNGAAVIARRIAERQSVRGDEVSFATWASPAALRRADEVWTHCGWPLVGGSFRAAARQDAGGVLRSGAPEVQCLEETARALV